MANLERYTKATLYINGTLTSESSSITVKQAGGGSPVKTIAKGYAGRSPGAPMTMISVDSAVPSSDFEFNPGIVIKNTEVVELTVFAAGRTLTSKGFITDSSFSYSTESNSKLSFEFEGEFAEFA